MNGYKAYIIKPMPSPGRSLELANSRPSRQTNSKQRHFCKFFFTDREEECVTSHNLFSMFCQHAGDTLTCYHTDGFEIAALNLMDIDELCGTMFPIIQTQNQSLG